MTRRNYIRPVRMGGRRHGFDADEQIFLQRESAEDALDFWLDVQQHENLCKAYFKVSAWTPSRSC